MTITTERASAADSGGGECKEPVSKPGSDHHNYPKGFAMFRTTTTTKRWGLRLAATAAFTVALGLIPAPAHAATCAPALPAGVTCTTEYIDGSQVTTIRSGTGQTLRAAFYDSWIRFSGDRLLYFGSDSCTATTTDTDFRLSFLPDGWSDRISSVEDYSGCDVNLYEDHYWEGESTGYKNYSDDQSGGGEHLSWDWHDRASSFTIS
jgi:hypothetical protein